GRTHCRTAHPLIDQEVTVAASTGSGSARPAKIRIRHLQQAKEAGRPFSMLTAYDQFSARAFEAAGIEALLVGDSVGTTVLGHSSTTATTHQDMLTFTGAVARSVHRPLLVADLAFGTYEAGPMDAVHHAVELVRAGAEMVKLEGGSAIAPQIRALVGERRPVEAAPAVQEAGASATVRELVPAEVSARITAELTTPTIGIGAGPSCDGQVLVWQDMAGLSGFAGKFVKAYAQLGAELERAAS